MKHLSRKPSTITIAFVFITLITLLLCSCEKDSTSAGPDGSVGNPWGNEGIYICEGSDPSIAGSETSDKAVLVFESDSAWGLRYKVGSVTGGDGDRSINWGDTYTVAGSEIGDGTICPSVSVSENGVVACAFQTCDYQSNPTGQSYAVTGTINGDYINWHGDTYAGISGYYPAISITRDGQYAVMVYQGSQNGGELYYRTTEVNTGSNSTNWSNELGYAQGLWPSIAINNQDQVISTLFSSADNGGVWWIAGTLDRASHVVGFGEVHGITASGFKDDDMGGPSVGICDYDSTSQPPGSNILVIYSSDTHDFCHRYGHLNSDNWVLWSESPVLDNSWMGNASVTYAYQGSRVNAHEDGNDADKLYYYFYQ